MATQKIEQMFVVIFQHKIMRPLLQARMEVLASGCGKEAITEAEKMLVAFKDPDEWKLCSVWPKFDSSEKE